MTRLPLRIFRSPQAAYYGDDILQGPDAYPDSYFDEAVCHGFNAVWLRGVLRDLVRTDIFPELGTDRERHADALRAVVDRGARHGVKVLLYLNEPLCLPDGHPFWAAHPECLGAGGASSMDGWPRARAFCTSEPLTRAWLREAMRRLFETVPGLGGWFAITASEHLTHCVSHRGWGVPEGLPRECPRCAGRHPSDIVAEVLVTLHAGTRDASREAATIAWNWSWRGIIEEDPQPRLLAQLPRDMIVMADFERGGTKTFRDGKTILVDEYSLSYAGPSERFMRVRAEASKHGLPVMAKLQIGTTHELATVPDLGVADRVYDKLRKAEELGLAGALMTWNFGNMFSLNTAVLGRMQRTAERPEPRAFVEGLASGYFPGCDAPGVAEAVGRLTLALEDYPFDMMLIYMGPMNWAVAYPLTLAPLTGKPAGRSWVMDERGDDLSASLKNVPVEEAIRRLRSVAAGWMEGVAKLEAALDGCRHEHAREELASAHAAGASFRSAANVYDVYRLRRDRPAGMEAEFSRILDDEIETLSCFLPFLRGDSRLGFHAECQAYQYTAETVEAKLAGLLAARDGRQGGIAKAES